MSKYFVWVQGLKGPEPQIWDEKDKLRDGKAVATLFKQELYPDEDKITLSGLKDRYPFEAKP